MEGKKEYRERMWATGLITAEYTNVYIFIDCLCWVCIPGQFFCPKVEDLPFSVNRVDTDRQTDRQRSKHAV